jgi:hypothetical protein
MRRPPLPLLFLIWLLFFLMLFAFLWSLMR